MCTNRLTKKLVVRECNLEHNHRIGPDVLVHYPSNRKLTEEQNAAINEGLSLQSKEKIYQGCPYFQNKDEE